MRLNRNGTTVFNDSTPWSLELPLESIDDAKPNRAPVLLTGVQGFPTTASFPSFAC